MGVGYDNGMDEDGMDDYFYDDEGSHLSEEEGQAEGNISAGAESPRSAALRAMGVHSVALEVNT